MSFDDIPEDEFESYRCPNCMEGEVTKNIVTGKWECDNCEFSAYDDE